MWHTVRNEADPGHPRNFLQVMWIPTMTKKTLGGHMAYCSSPGFNPGGEQWAMPNQRLKAVGILIFLTRMHSCFALAVKKIKVQTLISGTVGLVRTC